MQVHIGKIIDKT